MCVCIKNQWGWIFRMNKVCSLSSSLAIAVCMCFLLFFSSLRSDSIDSSREYDVCPLPIGVVIVFKAFCHCEITSVLDMKETIIILEWISFPNQRRTNSILAVRFFFRPKIFSDRLLLSKGQDVLPLTFKLYPQRSESVDNGNRVSPTNNGLQRVWSTAHCPSLQPLSFLEPFSARHRQSSRDRNSRFQTHSHLTLSSIRFDDHSSQSKFLEEIADHG